MFSVKTLLATLLLAFTVALKVRAPAVPVSGTISSLPRSDLSLKAKRDIWQPAVGSGWHIELAHPLTDTTPNVPVYFIDLFDNPAATITSLQRRDRRVICYFSAGTYENWRPDASSFRTSDYGNALDDFPDERWLNTNSANVRNIMKARLDLAVKKGCDGVDPDNVDAYSNGSGFDMTPTDAVDYVTFLANAAHARGLSIGLKNAAEIVTDVLSLVQWAVNEQCEEYSECDAFQDFIGAGKSVFHIEYLPSAPAVSQAMRNTICEGENPAGFSTVIKKENLDDWAMAC